MKLLITGGHVTPALAFIDDVLEKNRLKPQHMVFVGRKYVSSKERELSFEYQEIQNRKIKFIHLVAGRFTRTFSLQTIRNLLLVPIGFVRAWQIISKEKPYAILSFGGYIALPIAFAAFIRRIPVYTHEQTLVPGLTNKIIGRFARKVFVSFPQTVKSFPRQKTILSGNPVRQYVLSVEKAAFTINKNRPVIYVTGASTGSHSINAHIEHLLPDLLQHYVVIHQSGNMKEYKDFDRLSVMRESLAPELRKNYFLRTHFLTEEIGHVYKLADLVISRSGANTIIELVALKKPSILIPLPWSAYNEQELQAKLLQKAGVGEIFNQRDKSEKLADLIAMVMMNLEDYKKNFASLKDLYNPHAAEIIAKHILR